MKARPPPPHPPPPRPAPPHRNFLPTLRRWIWRPGSTSSDPHTPDMSLVPPSFFPFLLSLPSFHPQMEVETEEYQLKPMNCPFHVAIYKQGYHSYRDLPLRWAELGTVYRYERSGTMHGLFRVRGFTQVGSPRSGSLACQERQTNGEASLAKKERQMGRPAARLGPCSSTRYGVAVRLEWMVLSRHCVTVCVGHCHCTTSVPLVGGTNFLCVEPTCP